MRKTLLVFFLLLGLLSGTAHAQDLRISGTVTSQEDGSAIPGATVAVKGTTTGTTTDLNGGYVISAPAGSVLVFSFIGMLTEEITLEANSRVVDVVLVPDLMLLDEFVVTALGIRREAKSLGYALEEIDGDALMQSREANLANNLTGKVANLQVLRSSTGPAGSSKIVLRGFSSLTGDNQPLIIVDGMPLQNFTGAENNDYWNPSLDMGSGMADINPDDIATITVLKGASAAALYGSRAGNGVILITTKTGQERPGLGITFSTSVGTESMFSNPVMQTAFGQGTNGTFDALASSSWGPKIEGQSVEGWDGNTKTLSAYDNVSNFFNENGTIQNYNLSFQQQFNNVSVYTSMNRRNDQSIIPGAELTRTNLLTRAVSTFGSNDNWNVDAKVQYLNAVANNRPLLGVNYSNPFYTMYLLPTSMDITEFKDATNESGNMIWYGGSSQVNPYWTTQYNLNEDSRDRILLQGKLSNQITDWLRAEVSAGSDIYTTNSEGRIYAGSPLSANGRYSLGKETFFEHNFMGLMTGSKDNVISKLGLAGTFGGNIMMQEFSSIRSNSGELEVPNLFALNNGQNSPTVGEGFYQKRITSLFGSFQLNWDGYFFLEGTLRNDWSSTLSLDNRSFMYPSVNTSLVFSEMMEKMNMTLPTWFSFGKVRASYAQVGNSLQPYQLFNTYQIGNDPLGNTTANIGNVLFNPNVKSELITSTEVGTDLRFFQNRLRLDVAWYKSNAINQLIDLPMDPLSGFNSRKINAGDIQNTGVEIVSGLDIIEDMNGFSWSTQLNYSNNRNTIEALTDSVSLYALGGFDNLRINAAVGGVYGEIYGSGFLRVDDETSPYHGQMILTSEGFPQADPEPKRLGNQQPTSLLGISNTFAYKGVTLSFMIDGRFGGQMFSATNQAMQLAGTAEVTAPGGNREDIVVEGVTYDPETETYSTNTTSITQQQYWTAVAGSGNLGIIEANLYDATNVRLRYINLSYDLPRRILGNTPIQGARVGVSMNNVWLISSHLNGVDPESVYATGTNAIGFENAAPPTTRTVLFNLSVSF